MLVRFSPVSQKSLYFSGIKKSKHNKTLQNIPADCFVKSNSDKKLTLEDFLNKKDKLKISEYKSLNRNDVIFLKDDLCKEYNDYDKYVYAAGSTIELALDLKSELDDKYGQDRYIFVSIGQSPSLIAKAFECMGVETKYLPISDLGSKDGSLDTLFNQKTINNYGKLLEKQGLTKKNLNNTDKKVIFYDYTSSGASLAIFEYFMQKAYNLPRPKTEFRSLNNDLKSCAGNPDHTESFVEDFLASHGVAKYTSIDHLPYTKIASTDMNEENLTKHRFREAKLFNFLIMDELNKMGLLKENPKNLSAL